VQVRDVSTIKSRTEKKRKIQTHIRKIPYIKKIGGASVILIYILNLTDYIGSYDKDNYMVRKEKAMSSHAKLGRISRKS